MSKVLNFKCLRIQSELNKFIKTNSLPHDLFEGAFSIADIEQCYDSFPLHHKRAASKILDLYQKQLDDDYDELYEIFRKDYYVTIGTLRTRSDQFRFSQVSKSYRESLNPVTALYYEVRAAYRRHDPHCEYQIWLHSLVTNREFNNVLQDALYHDIARLERIVNRYYWPLKNSGHDVPLEIYHARSLVKDFKCHLEFFQTALSWELDD
jgi:hypothetical protein